MSKGTAKQGRAGMYPERLCSWPHLTLPGSGRQGKSAPLRELQASLLECSNYLALIE